MFALTKNVGMQFVDRGDPSAFDFTLTNFNTDGNAHDLDLSSIIPASAKVVRLWVRVRDNLTSVAVRFRKKGNSNWFVTEGLWSQHANGYYEAILNVPVGTDGKVEYLTSATTFTNIAATVLGWWL